MNEQEQLQLRLRALAALEATRRYEARGPKTQSARQTLRWWLRTGFFRREYDAMPDPEAAIGWLEYVARVGKEKIK